MPHAFTRLAWSSQTVLVQLGHYTIVGNPFLLQSRQPLGEIGEAGATSASRVCTVVIGGPTDWKRGFDFIFSPSTRMASCHRSGNIRQILDLGKRLSETCQDPTVAHRIRRFPQVKTAETFLLGADGEEALSGSGCEVSGSGATSFPAFR